MVHLGKKLSATPILKIPIFNTTSPNQRQADENRFSTQLHCIYLFSLLDPPSSIQIWIQKSMSSPTKHAMSATTSYHTARFHIGLTLTWVGARGANLLPKWHKRQSCVALHGRWPQSNFCCLQTLSGPSLRLIFSSVFCSKQWHVELDERIWDPESAVHWSHQQGDEWKGLLPCGPGVNKLTKNFQRNQACEINRLWNANQAAVMSVGLKK